MHKLLFCLLTSLIFPPCFADPSTETPAQIQDQDVDQSDCVQQRLPQCINTCESTADTDCQQACEENIKNECRYAGE